MSTVQDDRLPAPMRKAMYLACLAGASNALQGHLFGATHLQAAQRFTDAKHDLHRALHLLNMAQGGEGGEPFKPTTAPLHSEVEGIAIAVVSMAADGLDPNRPTPHDWALAGSVSTLYAYVATRAPGSP